MENSVKWYITRKILGVLSQICISLMILRLTTKSFLLFCDNEIILYTSEGSTISLTTMVLETLFAVLTIAVFRRNDPIKYGHRFPIDSKNIS